MSGWIVDVVTKTGSSTKESVKTKVREETRKPPMYRVLLHNDDYTTMEFVVQVLEQIFHRSGSDAVQIMLNVHQQGMGTAGVYSAEIAETKIDSVHSVAQKQGYPLKCTMEEE